MRNRLLPIVLDQDAPISNEGSCKKNKVVVNSTMHIFDQLGAGGKIDPLLVEALKKKR